MTPGAPFLRQLIGYRGASSTPNISDSDSKTSVRIARHIVEALGLQGNTNAPEAPGAARASRSPSSPRPAPRSAPAWLR